MKKYLILFLFPLLVNAQSAKVPIIPINEFYDGIHHWQLEHNEINYSRLAPYKTIEIANNFLAWQNKDGGWPKNIDWLAILNIDSVRNALRPKSRQSTLDNRNTFAQIRFLSTVYYYTKDKIYLRSAERGLNYLLATQNASGGWRGWDVDAITFNDEVMTGVMELFLEISDKNPIYDWITPSLRKQIIRSYKRALDVTLRCQVVVNGEKTVWCQQLDHNTLLPCNARTFELASLTANESCDVLLFLMKIKQPNQEIISAVESGVRWLEKSKINGIRVEKIPLSKDKIINHLYPYDLIVVEDSLAKPLWARFYEIETNRPFMCTRQGQKVYNLSEIDPERRTGYAWYGSWPEKVFKEYPLWKVRINKKN
jgi:PelA/Pel-15E family pectate lyase